MVKQIYKIPMPLSMEEYNLAQHYVTMVEKIAPSDPDSELIEMEEYDENSEHAKETDGKAGLYVHRRFHMEKKMPGVITMMAPKGSMETDIYSYVSFPMSKSVVKVPYMKEKFKIEIKSIQKADMGESENVFSLSPEDQKAIKSSFIDITTKPEEKKNLLPAEYKHSSGRAPLSKTWLKDAQDSKEKKFMTSYNLVESTFNVWGLQGKVEKSICASQEKIFHSMHREMFCYMGEHGKMPGWHGKSMDDIKALKAP